MVRPTSITSPVVVAPVISEEKLRELCAHQSEFPELDFKRTLDLEAKRDVVELAKDVGAMSVRGGFLVVGAHDDGRLSGELAVEGRQLFDEANLRSKLLRFLPPTLEIRTNTFEIDASLVALIYVAPNPAGCAVMRATGQYERNGKTEIVFRPGDIFWRDGTKSTRITPEGLEEIIRRRVASAKTEWIAEQQELRRYDIEQLQAAYESRTVADAPAAALTIELDTGTLTAAALELVRRDDRIPLQHLLKDAVRQARLLLDEDEFEADVGDIVDKLVVVASVFLEYELDEWFERAVRSLSEIYAFGLELAGHPQRYGHSTQISAQEKAPRLWLLIIERVYALGALAVRLGRWDAVRTLTVQQPAGFDDYYKNWLRHTITMASRAQHLTENQNGREVPISLLSLARADAVRLEPLRSDGIGAEDERLLTSLTQFDILSNLAAIDAARSTKGNVFYPNFGRFYGERVEPIVVRLLNDKQMRAEIFKSDDAFLAAALEAVNEAATGESFLLFSGFDGFDDRRIIDWIARHRDPGMTSGA